MHKVENYAPVYKILLTECCYMPSKYLYLLFAVLVVTFYIYLPAASGPYLSDDYPNLVNNDKILLTEISFQTIKEAVFSSSSSLFGRPLSVLSFTINYTLAGNKDPYFVKITNILIHIITGIGIFILTRLLLTRLITGASRENELIQPVSLFVTTFWLLHPLHVSTVLYSVQRMTLLSAFFIVYGLITYIKLREHTVKYNRHYPLLITSLVLFTALAFLSKENGALLPVFALLVELSVFRFHAHRETGKFIKIIHQLSLYLPVLFIVSYLAFKYITQMGEIIPPHYFTPEQRLLTQARVLMHYIGWLSLLNPMPLSLYHVDFELSSGLFTPPTTLISIFFIMSLLVISMVSIIKRKFLVLGFGLAWFFTGHLIESTTIPLILMYEHRNYLPGYGVVLILSFYFLKIIYARTDSHKKALLFSCILVLPLVLTYERAQAWMSDKSFVINMLEKQPGFSWAWEEAALFLSNRGNFEDAYKAAQYAQALAPDESTHIFTEAFMRCRHEPEKSMPEPLITKLLTAAKDEKLKPIDLTRYRDMINTCTGSEVNRETLQEIYVTGLENKNHLFQKFSMAALNVKR